MGIADDDHNSHLQALQNHYQVLGDSKWASRDGSSQDKTNQVGSTRPELH